MTVKDSAPSEERKNTDEGLRDERDRADEALAVARDAVEEDADSIVETARANADAILAAAREKADGQVDGTPSGPSAAIALDRAAEDEALAVERAAADQAVKEQREASARLLRRYLPLERDTTDEYLLTERARSDDAIANRDDFLGMVCHDLRDLLHGVALSSTMLSARLAARADSAVELVETARIQRYAARMSRLIGDLVDVAGIDAGKLAIEKAAGDVGALIPEVLDALQTVAAAKGVALETGNMQSPLLGYFDHDRLLQVLANLVANAIKFTPKGGNIQVLCERTGDDFEFSVCDTGEGIPPTMLEAIFERFSQVGKNDRRGLGLGLHISKCIVEAHGGTIYAQSTLGKGSRLVFTVPVSRGRETGAA